MDDKDLELAKQHLIAFSRSTAYRANHEDIHNLLGRLVARIEGLEKDRDEWAGCCGDARKERDAALARIEGLEMSRDDWKVRHDTLWEQGSKVAKERDAAQEALREIKGEAKT